MWLSIGSLYIHGIRSLVDFNLAVVKADCQTAKFNLPNISGYIRYACLYLYFVYRKTVACNLSKTIAYMLSSVMIHMMGVRPSVYFRSILPLFESSFVMETSGMESLE